MTRTFLRIARRSASLFVVLAVLVVSTHAQGVLQSLYGQVENGLFGSALASIGDVNGDGAPDFAVGVPTIASPGSVNVYSGATRTLLFTVGGVAPGDSFGAAVSGTGDANGDGIPDFVVGAPHLASSDPGYVRLLSGADGSVLLTITGPQPFEFGLAVAGVGDVDGDGRGDFAVGDPWDDRFFQDTGRVLVYSSADGSVLHDLAGFQGGGFLGGSVAAAGDVDGDGVIDLIAGTRAESPSTIAYARVFSLATGAALHTFVTTQTGDQTGASVAGVGDIDRDGFDDVAVGAYRFDSTAQDAGQVRVYSGADGHLLVAFTGDSQNMALGTSVAGAGDMDGDGWPDVLAGAPGLPFSEQDGLVRAYSGRTGQLLREWSGEPVYTLNGAGFGRVVAGLGDVDGDGADDVVAGAPNTEIGQPDEGLAKVLTYRLPETPLATVPGPGVPIYFARSVVGGADFDGDSVPDFVAGTPDVQQADGPQATVTAISGADGSVIHEFTEAISDWSQFGADVDLVGDLDGDGVEEILIGSRTDESIPEIGTSGAVFVRSGATGALIHVIHGESEHDSLGSSVRRAGDVDADGWEDIVVGIPDDDTVGLDRGSVAVYSGASGERILSLFGPTAHYPVNNTQFGEVVSGAGDVDGDGHADLLAGDEGDSIAGPGFGRVWVFSGATGNVLYTVPGTHFVDRFGAAVGPLGDIDGDGRSDFAVAGRGQANFDVAGRVAAISGATGATIWSTYSDPPLVDFGNHLRTDGDLDRDGVPDIVTGVPGDSTVGASLGGVRVVSGASGDVIRTIYGPGIPDAYSDFGQTASFVGDQDGDGFEDLVIAMAGYDGTVTNVGAAHIYSGVPPSWSGLGHANAGSWGTPSLWVEGDLIGGHSNQLAIGGEIAGAPTTLVAGLTQLSAPFKGGTLVPYPLLLLPLVANGNGAVTLSFGWPAGAPSGMRIYLQAWSADPGAVDGFAATNAVRGQVP